LDMFCFFNYICLIAEFATYVCLSVCGSHNSSRNRQKTAILEVVLGRLWDLQW